MADSNEPPTSINPYLVLSLSSSASSAEIKKAYKQLALRLHPDKVPHSERSAAHAKFQELALAYAILSDPRRKRRYDLTGSTTESLDIEEDDFDWTSFFRAQYADLVTVDKINDLKTEYQGSEEEVRDVLAAFTAAKGKMRAVFERVMMSNMLVDEERFRKIINRAIGKGLVEEFSAYKDETDRQKERRMKRALKEQEDAEKHAKELGIHDKLFGSIEGEAKRAAPNPREAATASEGEFAALIQQRVKGRMENFLDSLEEKYVEKPRKGGRGKKNRAVMLDEPPEEAFEKMAKRVKKEVAELEDFSQDILTENVKRGRKRSARVINEVSKDKGKEAISIKKRNRGQYVSGVNAS